MTTRWGILATGRIAKTLADAVVASSTGQLVAAASRNQDTADAFAAIYEGVTAHGSYQALVDDPEVEAIYVATPHPQHAQWTIRALEAGKAVLCEKPMGLNHPEVMAMVQAAADHDTLLLEAFMYRHHPQTLKLVELVRDGAIGEVRQIHVTFGFNAPFNASHRLFANDLGGGGIMDVGCYPVSMSRLIADAEPVSVTAHGALGPTGTDRFSAALLGFPDGISAQVATGVELALDNSLEVFGSAGRIRLRTPWLCPADWSFELIRGTETQTISGTAAPTYTYQVDEIDRCRAQDETQSQRMSWQDSLGNAKTLDAWRDSIGLTFDLEKPEAQRVPVHGRTLAKPAVDATSMAYGNVRGIDKPVSRLVMGCDNQPGITHAAVMFDYFFEAGGNTFDTAYIYGGGAMETLLGHWSTSRGVRDDIVIVGKGAHTPYNFPDQVAPQLTQTLDRLQTDHLDVYFLHRDNTDIGVDEWISVLNDEQARGRIRAFGGSNWTLDRVRAANDYAADNSKTGFAAVSNNFSLAQMISPVWPGCIAASDADFAAYLKETQLALFPWSSQARGFFTPRADAIRSQQASGIDSGYSNQPTDAEMRRCWFSDANFERRERAAELATRHEVAMINVALAYVLAQPFPCFPLVGPRQLAETRSCLTALGIPLSEQERDWLELRSDVI